MEHDMTEQKREPKDGERWWMKDTLTDRIFMTSYHTSRSDQFVNIAPVASHELVAELIAAVNAGRIALSNRDRNDLDEAAYKMLRFILAKADLAGLGE